MSVQKFKVLVIDDSPTALSLSRKTLEQAGFSVITQERAFGAGAIILAHKPDLVLLDIEMPVLDGVGLLRLLQENPRTRDTKVVLHSSLPEEKLTQMASQYGATGYVLKGDYGALPFRVRTFLM